MANMGQQQQMSTLMFSAFRKSLTPFQNQNEHPPGDLKICKVAQIWRVAHSKLEEGAYNAKGH
jgi:hypothetical protein